MPQAFVNIRPPTPKQSEFVYCGAQRQIICAGRRFGKTVGAAIKSALAIKDKKRVLYATPTSEQIERYWFEVTAYFQEAIRIGAFVKNETDHTLQVPGTEIRIKAKTAWNADTLRGDYADLLILDEFQLMNEDAWELVGQPMLLDRNGIAVFIYTPPSLHSGGLSKARDPRYASKMFLKAQADTTGVWKAFHFTSHDNPILSKEALIQLSKDMSLSAYRQEILAEDDPYQLGQLIYGTWNSETCKINRFPIPDTWPRYVGHDFGGANPAALFIAEVRHPLPLGAPGYLRYKDLVAYHEYLPGSGVPPQMQVDEFKKITAGHTVMKAAGGSHQEQDIRTAYAAFGWPIQEPGIRSVFAGIERVKGLMELNKLYVFNDLSNLLEELANYSWKLDEKNRPTNEINQKAKYHGLDCLRSIASSFSLDSITDDMGETIETLTFGPSYRRH